MTPWTVVLQAHLFMEFSRQEYWIGGLLPSSEDLPDLGIEPGSPALQADSLLSEPSGKPNMCGKKPVRNGQTLKSSSSYTWLQIRTH